MIDGACLCTIGIQPVFDQPFGIHGWQPFLFVAAVSFFGSRTVVVLIGGSFFGGGRPKRLWFVGGGGDSGIGGDTGETPIGSQQVVGRRFDDTDGREFGSHRWVIVDNTGFIQQLPSCLISGIRFRIVPQKSLN